MMMIVCKAMPRWSKRDARRSGSAVCSELASAVAGVVCVVKDSPMVTLWETPLWETPLWETPLWETPLWETPLFKPAAV